MGEELKIYVKGEVDLDRTPDFMSTGVPEIDDFLKISYGTVSMFFGTPFSGKTTICLSIALNELAKNKKVLYIDSENGVFPSRIHQMASRSKIGNLNNLKLLKLYSLNEVLKYAKNFMNNYDIVIIDSFSRPFLKSLHARSTRELEEKYQEKLVKSYDILTDLAGQVYSENKSLILVSEIKKIKRLKSKKDLKMLNFELPFANILFLAKNAYGVVVYDDTRVLYIDRHLFKPSFYEDGRVLVFEINDEGLEYVKEDFID
ncbi:MAG: hypothetical protein DRJ39_02065 [Thermoprotei archaeon]|nr:MAG: hypothetical protein DRJ44_00780 [Thermoprotei archaeon]RLE85142.1 MAG: hypothetical protein DRJ39_02065 [Thermoprotei archaeon]